MAPSDSSPLPDLTPDRLVERMAEALQAAGSPERLRRIPRWTQRVMRILQEQFIPREFTAILAGDGSVFAEGIAVAWAAKARDLAQARGATADGFAAQLAERLQADGRTRDVALQVESGDFPASPELHAHVIRRVFAPDFTERRAFVEGLAVGNRLPELLDRQARRNTTDATGIYLLLWLYWPEIAGLHSIPEVAHALEPFFAGNKNLAGVHWDERIRKLANRIGLSFRARQSRTRRPR